MDAFLLAFSVLTICLPVYVENLRRRFVREEMERREQLKDEGENNEHRFSQPGAEIELQEID